jgi:hypothetical protein
MHRSRNRPLPSRLVSRTRRRTLGAAALFLAASVAPVRSARAAFASAGPTNDRIVVPVGAWGPRLVAAGAIDPRRFAAAIRASGQPVDDSLVRLLTVGGGGVELDRANAYFLLDFLWAAGLANRNPILARGPMLSGGMARIGGFASTGGWTLGSRPPMEVYGQVPLLALDAPAQRRLEEVAAAVYRPCCDNPTSFPDCNHGMAMLALLALLASEGRDAPALFRAARVANTYWFPQQSVQLEAYVRASRGIGPGDLDPSEATGKALFSGSGSRRTAAWLAQRGLSPASAGIRC